MILQTRVRLLLRKLERFKQDTDLTDDLDHYNESLVHTCSLIIIIRINGESAKSEMTLLTMSFNLVLRFRRMSL